MRGLLLSLTGVLVGVFVILSFLDSQSEYRAEKALWRINREFEDMVKHKQTLTEFAVNRLADKYRRYIHDYQYSDLSLQAQYMVGNLFLFSENYDQARAEFNKALAKFVKDPELSSVVGASIAKSYLMQGDVNRALLEYKRIQSLYPLTKIGFTVPIYIARFYESKGMKSEAFDAYGKAYDFYQDIAFKHPKTVYEYKATRLMAMSLLSQNKWREGVEALGQWIFKYPKNDALGEAVPLINSVSIVQLHDYALPKEIYSNFIQKYPKHGFNEVLNKLVKSLQVLQDKAVVVNAPAK